MSNSKESSQNNWDKLHFLEILLEPGERIISLGTNARKQLVIHSNKGRTWVSTEAPMPYFDMVEITGINKEINDGK